MKKYVYILLFLISGCDNIYYLPGFDFESFKGTEAYELALAVKKENIDEIENIARNNEELIDFLDPKFGHSLLMLAVANGLDESAEKLLKLGANPNKRSQPSSENIEVTTPVFIACNYIYKGNCSSDILEMLIQYGGNINDQLEVRYLNATFITKETPLMIATESDCLYLIKKMVELGVDVNDYDYTNGKGPLSNCIIHDNLDVLEYLVIDMKAQIPDYIFVRPAYKGEPREELTIEDFLNEHSYPEWSSNYRIKQRILKFLEK